MEEDRGADGPADARPEAAALLDPEAQGILKPWILRTANPFIRDPARRAHR